jgi:NAD(P)-dependent dehydrogenase (short-subunit alcohol dehydrogenase family)
MGILVTGGGSGIGLAVSRRLLADGAAVTIAGRNAQRLRDARQILIDAGADPASIRVHAADMSREDAGRRAVEAASDLRGGLHAAVACAGDGQPAVRWVSVGRAGLRPGRHARCRLTERMPGPPKCRFYVLYVKMHAELPTMK